MLKPVYANNVSERDLRLMEKAVEQQNMEHKKLQAQATQISLELNSVSREMVNAARKIQNSEDKISQMEEQLKKLKTDLQSFEENLLNEDDNLIRTLSALQNLALKPTEALLVQPLTPVEIIRSAMLLRETVPYLEENARRLRLKLDKAFQQKQKVEKQVKRILSQKKQLVQEHKRMQRLVQKKSQWRNKVEIQSVQAKKNADKLANQAQDLRDLLNRLEEQRLEKLRKQEEERKRLAQLEKERLDKLAQEKKVEESKKADLIKYKPDIINEIGSNFIKAKGKLPMPARGPIITAYGEHKGKGLASKGIIIKTRNQAQVISPFDGSVIFAAPFRGYGNLIIIEHGKGYLTLLAGLETMDCELGQMLLAGEPVGLMPDNNEAKLYVELRKNNMPINPMAWMKKS